MKIEKNGRTYDVQDAGSVWKLRRTDGALTITYRVPKAAASDIEGLRRYIQDSHELF